MQTVPVYYTGLINAAEAENNKNEKTVAIFSLSTVMVRHWRRETFNQRNYFYISGWASGLMRSLLQGGRNISLTRFLPHYISLH